MLKNSSSPGLMPHSSTWKDVFACCVWMHDPLQPAASLVWRELLFSSLCDEQQMTYTFQMVLHASSRCSNCPHQIVLVCCRQIRDRYEKMLEDVSTYTPRYMEEMEAIFEESQEEERKRISFLKQAFLSIHRHLDITNNER